MTRSISVFKSFMPVCFLLISLLTTASCGSTKELEQKEKLRSTKTESIPIDSYQKTVLDFGAKGDGINDDINAIENAINAGVNPIVFPFGTYRISRSIKLPTRVQVLGNKSTILYQGRGAAFQALLNPKNKLSLDCEIRDLYIEVKGDGAKAIDASNFQYGNFTGLAIRISGHNTVGIFMQGNGKGTAPYYNNINNSYIIGDNDKNKSRNQIGILLGDNKTGGFTASGANANFFTNIKRIAGVSVAIDITAGTGNLFSNIQTEAIQDFHYRLNSRSPDRSGKLTGIKRRNSFDVSNLPKSRKNGDIVFVDKNKKQISSKIISIGKNSLSTDNSLSYPVKKELDYRFYEAKATSNRFINLRGEGTPNSVYIKICHGAMDNTFKDFAYTSTSAVSIIRETNSLSNTVGSITPIVLYAKNVQANSTTKLIPFSGPQGGIPIATKCRVDGVHIKGSNHGKGTCRVKVMRNSGEIDLAPYLSTENGFSNFEILKNYDSRSNARLRPGDGLQLELITDKNWTPNDITVTVWLAK